MAYGQSKHAANRDGSAADKIFSKDSYQAYLKVGGRYATYVQTVAPECKSLAKAFEAGYPMQYIDSMIDRQLSPYTIAQARSALAKLYGVDGEQIHPRIPVRRSKDITRSRRPIQRDLQLQEQYPDLYQAVRTSGLRAYKELAKITPRDIHISADGKVTIEVKRGKGGRPRVVTCLPGSDQLWRRLKEETPENQLLFPDIPHNSSLHQCRAEYCTQLYNQLAKPIDGLRGERIHVTDSRTGRTYEYPAIYRTKDGREYDREALIACSIQLGHGVTRSELVVNHYLRTS